jgi:hypothetical protein
MKQRRRRIEGGRCRCSCCGWSWLRARRWPCCRWIAIHPHNGIYVAARMILMIVIAILCLIITIDLFFLLYHSHNLISNQFNHLHLFRGTISSVFGTMTTIPFVTPITMMMTIGMLRSGILLLLKCSNVVGLDSIVCDRIIQDRKHNTFHYTFHFAQHISFYPEVNWVIIFVGTCITQTYIINFLIL